VFTNQYALPGAKRGQLTFLATAPRQNNFRDPTHQPAAENRKLATTELFVIGALAHSQNSLKKKKNSSCLFSDIREALNVGFLQCKTSRVNSLLPNVIRNQDGCFRAKRRYDTTPRTWFCVIWVCISSSSSSSTWTLRLLGARTRTRTRTRTIFALAHVRIRTRFSE